MRERRWTRAGDAFREALAADDRSVAAWEGLAAALMCVDEFDAARTALETAYRGAREADDRKPAARAAMQLAVFHEGFRGESAIANGWFERARTLLASCEPSPEHAWLALWEAHVDIHVRGEVARGQERLAEAVRMNDSGAASGELELLSRGLRGLMAISEGAVREGLRRLDEASSAAFSELPSPQTIGWTCCYVLDACERVRDFDRALQWLDRAFAAGRELAIPHFAGFCRSHYLGVLIWRGDYAAAEREATAALAAIGGIAPIYGALCEIRIGEIRRRQGRLEHAETMLEEHVAQPLAMLSLAALALDRGRAQRALDLAERYLRRVSSRDRVRRLHGLEYLIRAHVRLGNDAKAPQALEETRELARCAGTPLISALVDDLEGEVAAARGDLDAARRHLEDAVDAYELNAVPYEASAARLQLGAVLQRLGRADSAKAALRLAKRGAERIGARLLLDRAVRALESIAADGAGPRRPHDLTAREIEVLALVAEGVSNQQIAQRLCISAFTVKRHIANILTKLDLPSRAAAAAYAVRERILE
jgi:DNA-binding NarL/FixJ family response regulator